MNYNIAVILIVASIKFINYNKKHKNLGRALEFILVYFKYYFLSGTITVTRN